MRNVIRDVEYGNGMNHVRIWALGDIHAGGLIDEKLLDETIEEIRSDPCALWIGLGDAVDAIQRRDKRFNPESVADWAVSAKDICAKQVEYIVEKLKPIRGQCLGLLEGNHERTILDRWERNVYEETYLGLGVPPLSYSATMCIIFRRGTGKNRGGTRTLKLFLHHGLGAPSSNEEHALHMPLEKLGEWPDARISLMGHLHVLVSAITTKNFITPHGVSTKECLSARTGSFLKTLVDGVTTYGDVRGYKTGKLGAFSFYYKPESDLITLDYRKIGK